MFFQKISFLTLSLIFLLNNSSILCINVSLVRYFRAFDLRGKLLGIQERALGGAGENQ